MSLVTGCESSVLFSGPGSVTEGWAGVVVVTGWPVGSVGAAVYSNMVFLMSFKLADLVNIALEEGTYFKSEEWCEKHKS